MPSGEQHTLQCELPCSACSAACPSLHRMRLSFLWCMSTMHFNYQAQIYPIDLEYQKTLATSRKINKLKCLRRMYPQHSETHLNEGPSQADSVLTCMQAVNMVPITTTIAFSAHDCCHACRLTEQVMCSVSLHYDAAHLPVHSYLQDKF